MLDKYVSQSCLAAITNGEAAMEGFHSHRVCHWSGTVYYRYLMQLRRRCKGQQVGQTKARERVLEVPGRLGPRQFNSRRLLGSCAGLSVRWPPFLGLGLMRSRLAAATARRGPFENLSINRNFSLGDHGS
jgi:hypothetical protein